jgi:hypothetical protein
MASEVYVLERNTAREAWWQLSEEERQSFKEKMRKYRDGIAVKLLARFAVGPSVIMVVNVFPDMDTYQKAMMAAGCQGLNVQRYWDSDITLGHEAPPWGPVIPYASLSSPCGAFNSMSQQDFFFFIGPTDYLSYFLLRIGLSRNPNARYISL